MIQKLFRRIFPFILVLLSVFILGFPDIGRIGISAGLLVCRNTVLTVLFPFFVLSEILVLMGYTDRIARISAPVMSRLFHLPGDAALPYIMGMIGGYPVGAKMTADQYRKGTLSKTQAETLLLFCNNPGPAFMIGFIGAGIFNRPLLGIFLYICIIISSILLGLLFRQREPAIHRINKSPALPHSISKVMTDAIKNGGSTAIQVSVFILFFSVLTGYFRTFLPQQIQENIAIRFLLGCLELASGITSFAKNMPEHILLPAAGFMSAFGGFCVYLQSASIWEDTGLRPKYYLSAKAIQAVFCAILTVSTFPIITNDSICLGRSVLITAGLSVLFPTVICFLKKSTGKRA